MLNVMFLGTNGSIQERESGNTSLIITSNNDSVLVDVSVNIQQAIKAQIKAVIITHNHIDHVYGLVSLLHQAWLTGRTEALDIICPGPIISTISNLIDIFSIREKKNIFPLRIIEAKNHQYGSLTIKSFPTDHTDASIGLIFKDNSSKIVYTSDTRPITKIDDDYLNADLLIHEASGISENEEILIKKGHSSAKDAALFASTINTKRLLLCHLPTSETKLKVLEEARSLFVKSEIPQILVNYCASTIE